MLYMRISSFRRYMFFLIMILANLRDQLGSGQESSPDFHCGPEARCWRNGPPIKFPFRLKNSNHRHLLDQANNNCTGYPGFDLFCVGKETAIQLPSPINTLFISKIDYRLQEIFVYSHEYADCLGNLLVSELFSNQTLINVIPFEFGSYKGNKSSYTRLHCPGNSSSRNIILVPSNSEIQHFEQFGVLFCAKRYDVKSVPEKIYRMWSKYPFNGNVTLTWSKPGCRSCEVKHKGCRQRINGADDHQLDQITECFDIPRTRGGRLRFPSVVGTTCSIVLLVLVGTATFCVYTSYKNDKETQQRMRKFLQDYIALKPSRYSYVDIKKITNQFKDKLGEGAYGTVFKGKLSDGVLVAVKILNHSNGNGEEFLNEVSTIGQIHHINVVRLVGYCAEGLKRALVYEFLPNDSLDKYISSDGSRLLSWETMQDISLGIASGIEYLHQGCDQRILHFDIKPQNILLDHNFKPKISDFGLAKLCSKDQSIVSMTTARGTIGYIAPEVFSKTFGNVSYKSDVYSFGMLLLEMVGGRKNINVTEEKIDEIYYPEWIYNILEGGEDHRIQIEGRGDAKIAKRLAIVGLWCIQWHPMGRPTMKDVVQMLDGAEELTMPPSPFAAMDRETKTKPPPRRMTLELETIAE